MRRALIGALRALLVCGAVGVLGTAAGCGGGGGGTAPVAPAPAVAPGTWVVLGSSTAAGTGAPQGQGWVALLAAEMLPRGVGVVNLAAGGAVTSQALASGSAVPAGRPPPDPLRNVDAAMARVPRLLLLAFPTNDTAAGFSADETLANLQAVAGSARAGGAAVLVLSTQPRDGFSPAQQAVLDDIDRRSAALFGPCLVPLRAALAGSDGGIAAAFGAGDGVHLNAAGHALIAQRVGEVLRAGQCVRL